MKRLSLRSKTTALILAGFAVIASTFLAADLFMAARLTDDHVQTIGLMLETLVDWEHDEMAGEILEGRSRALRARLDQMAELEDVTGITALAADGRALAVSGKSRIKGPDADPLRLSAPGAGQRARSVTQSGGHLIFQEEIRLIGERLGVIVIEYSLARFRARHQTLRWIVAGLMTAVLTGLILLFNLLLSRLVVGPVIRLGRAMSGLRREQLGQVLAVDRNDEIGDLYQAYNDMSQQIARSYELIARQNTELEDHRQHLEVLVDQRTAELTRTLDRLLAEVEEKRRTEAELDESRRRLDSLVGNVRGMVYRCRNDANWTMRFVSKGGVDLTGYRSEDLVDNRTIAYGTIIHADDRLAVWENIQTALAAGRRFELVYRIHPRQGGVKWVWEHGSGVIGKGGRVVALEGFITDISQLKRAEETIRASLREKEILLREVHHRVKNNMQVVRSLLRLQALQLEEGPGRTALEESRNRVHTMALLHETLYRSDDLTRVDIRAYVYDLVAWLERFFGIEGGQVVVEQNVDQVELNLDRLISCGLIINELISNSLKYAFPGAVSGTIVITIGEINEDEVELVVSDDGIGLPPDFNLERTESLGLSLVRLLAEEQLNGRMEIKTGEGLEVRVIFGRPRPLKHRRGPMTSQSGGILIVEDNRIVAEDLRLSLSELGYEVKAVVGSGEAALEAIENHRPGLVLMDIMLAGELNGIDTAMRIRNEADLPVIFVTAYADRQILQRAKMTEPFGYIVKPFEDLELQVTIESALYKHRMEARLRASEEWFSTTLNSIGDGVIASDAEGLVSFINPVAESLTGWTGNQAAGRPVAEVFHIVNEKTRHPVEDPVKKVIDTGQVVGLANHTLLLSRDGREIPIEDSGAPITARDGGLVGVVLIFRDATDVRQAQTMLADSEELYRTLFETGHDAILLADGENGRIVQANNRAVDLLERPHDELIGSSQESYFPEREWGRLKTAAAARSGKEQQTTRETWVVTGARRTVPVEVGVSYLAGTGSRMVLTIVRDISERKRVEWERRELEDLMRQSHKMEAIGTLAGGIAHDFNNMLAVIIGHAQLAKEDLPKDSAQQVDMEKILAAAQRSKELVRQVLTFSQQGSAGEEELDLKPLIVDVIKMMRSSLPVTIEIESELESDGIKVRADKGQMQQMLINLCTNAAEAMKDGGRLMVKLGRTSIAMTQALPGGAGPGEYACLTVSDTGAGVDPEILSRIFDPFFTTKAPTESTGMGLAVVHGIVNSHHGAVEVDNAPDGGAEFRISLPMIQRAGDRTNASGRNVSSEVGERILFVDDEEVLSQLGKVSLERLGYRVTASTSAVQALEQFRADPTGFDVVVTDYTMPRMTGADLTKGILEIRPDVPIIMCTGYNEQISESQALAIGVSRFAMKPLETGQLAGLIREVLGPRND